MADRRLADNVLRMLEDRNWSQTYLAEIAGVTDTCISRIVCGQRLTHLVTLRKLKDAFGCTWEELLDGPEC